MFAFVARRTSSQMPQRLADLDISKPEHGSEHGDWTLVEYNAVGIGRSSSRKSVTFFNPLAVSHKEGSSV